MGCNLSGNPLLSTRELSSFELGKNTLTLVGCDENDIAKGATILENLFKDCLVIVIGNENSLEPKTQKLPTHPPIIIKKEDQIHQLNMDLIKQDHEALPTIPMISPEVRTLQTSVQQANPRIAAILTSSPTKPTISQDELKLNTIQPTGSSTLPTEPTSTHYPSTIQLTSLTQCFTQHTDPQYQVTPPPSPMLPVVSQ